MNELATPLKIGLSLVLVLVLFFVTAAWGKQALPELTLLTWNDYIDPQLLTDFQQKQGINIKQISYETEDALDRMLAQGRGKGYDLVLSSVARLRKYIHNDWISPVDAQKIPNRKHIDLVWQARMPAADRYCTPYLWGSLGIAYRRDLVGEEITSWKQLFQPKKSLQGKILMLKDHRDLIGMALKSLGFSLNSKDQSALAAAEKLLYTQRPAVLDYGYLRLGKDSSLVTAKVWMAMAYNGDALTLKAHHPDIAFSVPKEGTNLWMDCIAVMAASTKKEQAFAWINFLNEPKNAAKLAIYLNYATPNKAAEKRLPAAFLANPAIYPSQQVVQNSEFFEELPPRTLKRYLSIFSTLTHSGR